MIDPDRLCKALDGAIPICMDLFVVGLGLAIFTTLRAAILGVVMSTDDLSNGMMTVSACMMLGFPAGLILTALHNHIEPWYSEDDT